MDKFESSYNKFMKKVLIADLVKAAAYPDVIEFVVFASTGFWHKPGTRNYTTFGKEDPYQIYNSETKEWEAGPTGTTGMRVKGELIDNTDLYNVTAMSPEGTIYPYLIPYKDLLNWSNDTSGSYYNSHIRGKFRPK